MLTHKFRSVGSGQWSGLSSIQSGPKSWQSLYGRANTHLLVWPFGPDQNVGNGQTKQTEKCYWAVRADRNTRISHTKQTEIWVLAGRKRPKYGY